MHYKLARVFIVVLASINALGDLAFGDAASECANEKISDPEKLIAACSEMIDGNLQVDWAFQRRGAAYYALRKYGKAVDDFTHAIELNPKSAIAYTQRGIAEDLSKQLNLALLDFQKAIALDSSYFLPYSWRGFVNMQESDFEQALRDADRSLELNPNHPLAHTIRLIIFTRKGEMDRAKIESEAIKKLWKERQSPK